jgi:hypothetical protein
MDPAQSKSHPHNYGKHYHAVNQQFGRHIKTEASDNEDVAKVATARADEVDRPSATIRQVQQTNIENVMQTCKPAVPAAIRTHTLE